jgi:DNA mismatch repair protein MutS2
VESYKKKYLNNLNKLEDKLKNQRSIMEFESKYLNLGKRVKKLIELYRNGSSMKSILPRLKKIIEKESNRKEEKITDLKLIKKRESRAKETFKVGQQVRIEGTNQQGEILELKSNTALLQIGFAKMEVKFEKLEKSYRDRQDQYLYHYQQY